MIVKNKQHYVYKTKLPDGRFYIGYHYGEINDAYYGSSKELKKVIKESVNKHLIKCILSVHTTEKSARRTEREQTDLVDASNNSQYLNLIKGGCGCILAGKTLEEVFGIEKAKEIKRKRSESSRGRIISEEQRKLASERMKGNIPWNKGMILDITDPRCKGGRKNKDKKVWNKGLVGDEYKEHYKETGLMPPSHSGLVWINNSEIHKKVLPNNIPEGWVKGNLYYTGDGNPMKKQDTVIKNVQSRKRNKNEN